MTVTLVYTLSVDGLPFRKDLLTPWMAVTLIDFYIDADPPQILHVYDTVFHGLSASLTPDQVSAISDHLSVLAVIQDRLQSLHTTRSPQFLGLRNQRGLWSESDYGSDIIVGVFDTGVRPEHRSFTDKNLGAILWRWKGVCETGTKFAKSNCNRKLIGARFFIKGHEAAANDTVEYRSQRNADGHGTHTASTAIGRYAFELYAGPVRTGSERPPCSTPIDFVGYRIQAYAYFGSALCT